MEGGLGSDLDSVCLLNSHLSRILISGFPGDSPVLLSPEQWKVLSPWRALSQMGLWDQRALSLQEGPQCVLGCLLQSSRVCSLLSLGPFAFDLG